MTTLLVADIGGTKSELAIYPAAGDGGQPLVQQRYLNADFTGIEPIIDRFLGEFGPAPEFACLAVAAVVSGQRARLTNLPWSLDCRRLEQRFGFRRAILINDLTALCSSIAILQPADLLEIQAGDGRGGQVRGIVAPGTGLGEGLLVELGGRLFAQGSEGGHTDFAPVDEEQVALLAWMQQKVRPVSYELLIAGPGLASLYAFCREYHGIEESAWIVTAMDRARDRIPVILAGATGTIGDAVCPLCRRTIELFLSILGSEAGNLALKLYARGGIYLGGGILPRLAGQISFAGFLAGFRAKGQMAGLMHDIPVSLIVRKDAPLLGAASFARQFFSEDPR